MINPFVTKGYAGPAYFCDRVKETKDMVQLLTNENNLALISPRRLGKTDLIHHCFAQPAIVNKYYTFIIDIYATSSLADFVDVLGQAIFEELKPLGKKVWEHFYNSLHSVQQQISFDINGNPVWGLGLGAFVNPSTTLDEIFGYLATADKPCLVAIDEFQKIIDYPNGQNVEAALRTHIQRCPNATFLFSGSKRHLMSEMFMSPSRPFYQSVITMGLSPIPEEKYSEFAERLFKENGKALASDVVPEVYSRFDGVTFCLQRIMNVLFMTTAKGELCTSSMIDDAINYILDLGSEHYEMLYSQMSEKQRGAFLAIATERRAKGIASGKFVHKHRLQSVSSVVSAVKGLLEKDFITKENEEYYVYDHFFLLWLQKQRILSTFPCQDPLF
ncbi:MAG: ATP-binding protein [Bacteroidaceae bacterium]|nr:ATP-binding protein [Bacteroidaceae bacterium]